MINGWFSRDKKNGKSFLMKVSSTGGRASQLTDYSVSSPTISKDGKWIACEYFNPGQPSSLAPIRWTPDDHAISFLVAPKGKSSIWEQPLSGAPPKQVTDLPWPSDIMFYDWSRDGRLILCHGRSVTDAALIRNFH